MFRLFLYTEYPTEARAIPDESLKPFGLRELFGTPLHSKDPGQGIFGVTNPVACGFQALLLAFGHVALGRSGRLRCRYLLEHTSQIPKVLHWLKLTGWPLNFGSETSQQPDLGTRMQHRGDKGDVLTKVSIQTCTSLRP